MKFLAIMLLAVMFPSLPQQSAFDLSIGATLPREMIPKEQTETILFMRALKFRPFVEKEVEKVNYTIVYEEGTRQIIQITTYDKDFKSQDGLKTGMFVEVKREWFSPLAMGVRLGPKTTDGWRTIIGSAGQITILKNGNEAKLKDEERVFDEGNPVLAKIIGFVKS